MFQTVIANCVTVLHILLRKIKHILNFAATRPDVFCGMMEKFRIFRTEKTYAVKTGKWYFEFEVVTAGDMRVGWARPGCQPDQELGSDEQGFVFDGFKVSFQLAGAFYC